MPEVEVPQSGTLSIDQAVAALSEKEKQQPEPETPSSPEPVSSEAAPTAPDTPAAETPSESEPAAEDQPAEGEQPEPPAIDPPQFWDAEAKKRFGELPRDVQEVILKNEQTRNAATSKQIQEAAETRKRAEAVEQRLGQYTQALDRLIPQAAQTFKSRWEGVDWNATVDQLGADQALKLRNQMEQEAVQLQQLTAAKQEADRFQHQKFVEAEQAKLPELAPDLADPKRRVELAEWLIKTGVNPQVLPNLSALETSLAYDAMRWRNAQAKAKTLASQPKQQPAQPARSPVKPTANQGPRNPQSARLQELSRKRSLSTDEAVELLNLRNM